MKECSVCESLFTPYNSQQKYCCVRCRNHNPTKSESTRRYQKGRRDWLNELKVSSGCAVCGYNEHPAALDFNHISGDKQFNISQDPKRAKSAILEEIAKCEILCANCHRIKTYEGRHWHTKRKSSETL